MVKSKTFRPDQLDSRPLNVFALPEEVLTGLVPVGDQKDGSVADDVVAMRKEEERLNHATLQKLNIQQEENEDNDTLTCGTCQQIFKERQEHRQHFATDWHRYNIKRKLLFDQLPVSLTEFEDMIADLSDSISGSDTEDDESDVEISQVEKNEMGSNLETINEEDKVAALVGKQQLELDETEAIERQVSESVNQLAMKSPLQQKYTSLLWFTVPSLTNLPFHIGVYRPLMGPETDIDPLEFIKQHQSIASIPRLWTILVMGGGHFAGAVIDVNQSRGLEEQQLNKQVHLITHKTFHRYTTRRKQGGSQSANDNGKGKANSAGAQIRRYNEMALQQDIRELLDQWKKYIDQSERIFLHAPSGNKKIVYGYDNAVLQKDNPKVQGVPFTTRRPTLNEIRRVYLELTTLKVVQVDDQSILKHQERVKELERRLRQRLEKAKVKTTEGNRQQKEDGNPVLEKFVGLVKQGKVNVVESYLNKHPEISLDGTLSSDLSDGGRHSTILHIAAAQGHVELVSIFLRKFNCNPTIKNDIGRTAYEVAKDKATRNVFRRCMCDLPDMWAWLAEARVPSALTLEDEKEQLEKDRKKKAKEDEKKRLLEVERQQREEARLAKEEEELLEARNMANSRNKKKSGLKAGGHLLDPMARALRDNQVNVANMSPEARMRLEREKRARAAEERLRRK